MTENLLFVYSLFFLIAFVFSLVINRFLLKFSRTLGMRNSSDTIIRWSSTSKPALGGISFFILFLFSVIVISFMRNGHAEFFNLQFLGIIGAVSIGFLLGLFDDAYNTHPWIKFFTQLFCGFLLIITGTYISLFESQALNYALTLFWVVGMMNSINMLDNMDGITTVTSLAVLLAIFLGIALRADWHNPLLFIVMGVMAALMGFLWYNWHPSKMYMGDTGSQFLGVLLAAIGVNCFWNGMAFTSEATAVMKVLAVAIIFALPIIDTTTVSIKRIARGQSPFVGGRDHTTHHLSYLGLTDRQIALLFSFISLVSVALTVVLTHYIGQWKSHYTLLFGSYFLVLFAFLFIVAGMNRHRRV